MPLRGAPALVAAAKRKKGARNDRHLAQILWRDYGVDADQPKVGRWRRGLSAPNHEATIALLMAADWLTEEARRALAGEVAAAAAALGRQAEEAVKPPRRGKAA